MRPEIIAAISGVSAVALSGLISYLISLRTAKNQARLGYLQTVLSDETILRNFRFFWRQLNALRTFYRLFPSQIETIPNFDNNVVRDDIEVIFAYLRDRLTYEKRKLEKDGNHLKDFEEQVLALIKEEMEKEELTTILKEPHFLKNLESCVADAHRYFHTRGGEAWFSVLFGPAPKLQKQISEMARTSILWKGDLTKWDKLSQLLGKFVAGNW